MKYSNAFALLLAVSVVAGPIDSRSLRDQESLLALGINTQSVPLKKAFKTETLTPTIPGNDVKRVRMSYGPFKVKGKGSKAWEGTMPSMDPSGTAWSYLTPDFPTDVTILNGKMTVEFEDGSEINNANGVYNHHAFFLDLSKPTKGNVGCTGKLASKNLAPLNSVMGGAADLSDVIKANVTTRPTTGTYVAKGHGILLIGDFVNYNDVTKEIFMVSDMQYIERKGVGLTELQLNLISIEDCTAGASPAAAFIKPPEGKKQFSLKGEGFNIKEDGQIVVMRGHMHDGAVKEIFYLNGKEICTSNAEYHDLNNQVKSDEGLIKNMSDCIKTIDVKKGDKLSMEAFYDLDLHPPRMHPGGGMSEEMAIMVVIFGKKIK